MSKQKERLTISDFKPLLQCKHQFFLKIFYIKNNILNIKYLFPALLFFCMMFLPQSYSELKLILLIFSLIFLIITLKSKGVYYSKKYIYWFLFYLSFYLIWILYGIFNNNPGTNDYLRVQVLWPIVYFILISTIDSVSIIYKVFKLIVITGFIISIYNFYKVLEVLNYVPHLFNLDDNFAVGFHSGFTQIVTLNIGTLAYVLPFVICLITIKTSSYKLIGVSPFFIKLTLLLTTLCAILSGRRVLWFSIILTLILVFLFFLLTNRLRLNSKKNIYRLLLGVTLTVSLIIVIRNYIDVDDLSDRIFEEFNTSNTTPRYLQKNALIEAFYSKPLLGTGFGVGVNDVIRSYERPWTYELTYHLYLYNTGIVGIVFFFFLLGFPIVRGVMIIRRNFNFSHIIYPTIVSYIIVLFASGTNPYLTSSFDFEWMLFLPIAILNRVEIEIARQNRYKESIVV